MPSAASAEDSDSELANVFKLMMVILFTNDVSERAFSALKGVKT